jgi:hypothetical protein
MPTTVMRVSNPSSGPSVPTATLRLAFLAVAAGLCMLVLDSHFWLGIGLLVAIAATLVPQVVSPVWLLLMLGLSQLWRAPSTSDVVFYLLLAGVHLLHVLSSLARLLPWRGRIQVVALVRPLKRFVLVQAVSQIVAAGALFTFAGARGAATGLSILAAALLGVVAAVLALGVRRAEARGYSPES